MNKNVSVSKAVAKLVGARPHQCYANSILAMSHFGKPTYVEGIFLLDGTMPIEHGWLLVEGEVIDVTLPEDKGTYHPVYSWSEDEVLTLIDEKKTIPFEENLFKSALDYVNFLRSIMKGE